MRTDSVGRIQKIQGGHQPATEMEPDLEWAACSRVSKFSRGETHAFCGRRVGAMCAESVHCMASVGDPWGTRQRECSSGRCWAPEAGWPNLTAAGQRLPGCLCCTYVVGGDCSPSAAGYLCLLYAVGTVWIEEHLPSLCVSPTNFSSSPNGKPSG